MGEMVMGKTEISEYINSEKTNARIDGIKDDIKSIRTDINHIVKGMETTRKTDATVIDMGEKIRLMGQRVLHLEGIGTPAWYEQELHTIKDIVYKLQTELREEVSKWQKFREEKYFQVVTYEEMLNTYKISGITLSVLSDKVHMDTTGLSKWRNGHRKSHDYELYHRIKQACLEFMADK